MSQEVSGNEAAALRDVVKQRNEQLDEAHLLLQALGNVALHNPDAVGVDVAAKRVVEYCTKYGVVL